MVDFLGGFWFHYILESRVKDAEFGHRWQHHLRLTNLKPCDNSWQCKTNVSKAAAKLLDFKAALPSVINYRMQLADFLHGSSVRMMNLH